MAFMRAVSIIIVLMHLYWFCYGFFIERGWTLELINKILGNFQRTAGLFSHTLIYQSLRFGFVGFELFGNKGVKDEKITWSKIYVALAIGIIPFFLNFPLLKLPLLIATFLYILTTGLGYIALMVAGVWWAVCFRNNLMDDVFK